MQHRTPPGLHQDSTRTTGLPACPDCCLVWSLTSPPAGREQTVRQWDLLWEIKPSLSSSSSSPRPGPGIEKLLAGCQSAVCWGDTARSPCSSVCIARARTGGGALALSVTADAALTAAQLWQCGSHQCKHCGVMVWLIQKLWRTSVLSPPPAQINQSSLVIIMMRKWWNFTREWSDVLSGTVKPLSPSCDWAGQGPLSLSLPPSLSQLPLSSYQSLINDSEGLLTLSLCIYLINQIPRWP